MKLHFWIDADDDIIELDDDLTKEEIEEEFQMWVDGSLSCGWWIEEDD